MARIHRKAADSITEVINVPIDAIIIMDGQGSWEYENDDYSWAESLDSSDGCYYSDEYPSVMLDDPVGVVEKIDELIMVALPMDAGTYQISGDAYLSYTIDNVDQLSEYIREEDDGSPAFDVDYDTYEANVSYQFIDSKVENFEYQLL